LNKFWCSGVYTKVYSNTFAFAALKADGSITAWGDSNKGGSRAPAGSGYTKIYSTGGAFAALKTDGSIAAWGDSDSPHALIDPSALRAAKALAVE
jgi:hypothetical protein